MKAAVEAVQPDCRIVVNSIGDAGARMVGVLKQVLPQSEARLAALLYQAPSELIGGLTCEQAEKINTLLCTTGLDSQVLHKGQRFTPGAPDYEVALAIKSGANLPAIAHQIMELLGVKADKARAILCSSPTVLMGSVSANTVAALQRRFEPLGVELDVSQPAIATFDLFLGDCPPREAERVKQLVRDVKLPLLEAQDGTPQPLLAVGLSKVQADRLWDQLRRTSLPARLVNRDFERFDVRLDAAPSAAPQSQALAEYLVATTGMPERLAPKVLAKTPVVIQQNIPFAAMAAHLDAITARGGRASGHLLAFQVFAVAMDKVGDPTATAQLLQVLGGLSPQEALAAVGPAHPTVGAMTNPQARWLQQELKRVGSEGRVILQ
ncbi:MAG: hypothetical protein U0X20_12050 [Caldilineaceae bacterium]